MNGYTLAAVVVVCLLALALSFRFRERLKMSLKVLGFNFTAEGKTNAPPPGAAVGASGDRAVSIGHDFEGRIVTGDRLQAGPMQGSAPGAASRDASDTKAKQTQGTSSAGGVSSAGSRSVAIGGNATGIITTGDQKGR
jgi:hypothetical protein